jgi:hypothetical protein
MNHGVALRTGILLHHMNGLASLCVRSHRMSTLFFGRLSVVQSSLCSRGELEISHADEFVARLWRQISSVPATYDMPTHTRTAAHLR